jgi:hypothetical protein
MIWPEPRLCAAYFGKQRDHKEGYAIHANFPPWMSLLERFFGDLTAFITEQRSASTRERASAIITFLAARNENPQRFVRTAKHEDTLYKSGTQAARSPLIQLPT